MAYQLTYEEAGAVMMHPSAWKPESPQNGYGWIAGIIFGLVVLAYSSPADQPGNLVIAVLGGIIFGSLVSTLEIK